MIRLKALKNLRYGTRRLLPGDVFDAKPRDGKVLIATRKVEAMREPVHVPAPPPALAEKIAATVAPLIQDKAIEWPRSGVETNSEDDLADTRAMYEKAVGKKPFHGWDIATLRDKIAAAKAES